MSTANQTNTANQKLRSEITSDLLLVNANVSPIMSYIYRRGQNKKVTSTSFEWVNHSTRKMISRLGKAFGSGETSLELEDGSMLVKDAILTIGTEVVKVTSCDAEAGTATVTRGYMGTSKADHLIGARVQSLGIEMEEGGELKKSSTTVATSVDNYTGIVYEEFEVTDSAAAVRPEGQGSVSTVALEAEKKKDELMGILENKTLNGIRYKSQDGKTRMSGGIKFLINEGGIVIDMGGRPLTEKAINDAAQKITEAGTVGAANFAAGKYKLCAPYYIVREVNDFNKNALRTGIEDKTVGIITEEVVTAFGAAKVFPAPSLADDEVLLTNLDDAIIRELIPLRQEKGARKAVSTTYFFSGEQGLEMRNLPFQVHIKNIGKAAPKKNGK